MTVTSYASASGMLLLLLLFTTTTTTLVQPADGASAATTSSSAPSATSAKPTTTDGLATAAATTSDIIPTTYGNYTTSSSDVPLDDGISEKCRDDLMACLADETCIGCINAAIEDSEEYEECRGALDVDDVLSSTESCADNMAAPCCIDQVSEHQCLANGAFKEWFACLLANVGCSEDIMTCESSRASAVGTGHPWTIGFSGAIVIFLPLLWP